jgi:Uma2 family endonuclease
MTIASSRSQTNAAPPKMTLEEYLAYDDGTDQRCELVNGVLAAMGAENPINPQIAMMLAFVLSDLGVPRKQIIIGHQIGVSSPQATSRQPDLVIHTDASRSAILADGQLLREGLPVPMLVVEVVSSSDTDQKSRDRDYVDKRSEYQARGIPEYWIIDPIKAVVIVLHLQQGRYVGKTFTGQKRIISPTFPQFNLTAEALLAGDI